ncbi:MAG TPA: glycosyltransferase [Candidatus Tyrphobacter sp.]|nr:glycosyltransferase [Candidatus Tyrphobacter sp.]
MKIILATESFYPLISGVSVSTALLAEKLAENGHEVLVVTPSDNFSRSLTEHSTLKNLKIYRLRSLPNPFRSDSRIAILIQKKVEEIMNGFKPDVVHLQDPAEIGEAVLKEAKKVGVPVVITNHFSLESVTAYLRHLGFLEKIVPVFLLRRFKRIYNQCECVITPTRVVAQVVKSWGVAVPVRVIPNGVDINRFHPQDPDPEIFARYNLSPTKPVVLYVGRLDHDKSPETLFYAVSRLKQKGFEADLAILGRGDLSEVCRELAKELDIEDRVKFLGALPHESPDLPKIYRLAKVFLIPSIETQSLAVLEALATGLPIVGVDAGALAEIITPGKNGFLFPLADTEAIADLVSDLLTKPDLAAEMKKNNIELAARFSLEKVSREMIGLYTEMAAKNKPHA